MGSFREIRRRLKAVQGTAKITRAMQLVAASKMRHAQLAALAGRRHSLRLEELAGRLATSTCGVELLPPLLRPRAPQVRGIVFVATDRGLCGSLNQNTFKVIRAEDAKNAKYVAIGKKGAQLLLANGLPLLAEFPMNDGMPFFQARAVANFLKNAYLSGEIDSVEFVYPLYVNTLHQEALLKKILPLADSRDHLLKKCALLPKEGEPLPLDPRELCIEPSLAELLTALVEHFFQLEIYHLLLEAKAAEQSARMVAMKAATDNAEELIKELEIAYNNARQATITNEILEITQN
ncbi:MAG: ATP synthase F1 subunit gamma [Puniceicoccales bacterium]|jgi:F-type H+-transporting ATPase subunit gamma|nr:ATP synthase F1 subunit gamma [Puniceicoccales bacterium]